VTDEEILQQIRTLVNEEHELRSTGERVDEEQIASLDAALDQCWDLLRQRRAHREFGLDASQTSVRDVGTVEHYEQ